MPRPVALLLLFSPCFLAAPAIVAESPLSESSQEELRFPLGFEELEEPERLAALEELAQESGTEGCFANWVAPLLTASHDGSHRVRRQAVHMLAFCGQQKAAPQIAQRLLDMVQDPAQAEELEDILIRSLGGLGVAAPNVLQDLVSRVYKSKQRHLSQRAVAALGQIGIATDDVLEAVLTKMKQGPRSPRVTALVALHALSGNLLSREAHVISNVVGAVAALLPAPDIDVNQQAAFLLGSLGTEAGEAVPALIKTLEQRRFSRSQVAYALAEIGRPALSAIAPLQNLTAKAEGLEKSSMAQALEKLISIQNTAAIQAASVPSSNEEKEPR